MLQGRAGPSRKPWAANQFKKVRPYGLTRVQSICCHRRSCFMMFYVICWRKVCITRITAVRCEMVGSSLPSSYLPKITSSPVSVPSGKGMEGPARNGKGRPILEGKGSLQCHWTCFPAGLYLWGLREQVCTKAFWRNGWGGGALVSEKLNDKIHVT